MSNNVLSGLEFKAKHVTVFYKILRSDLVHHGFKYQLGLNIDTQLFNPSGSCKSGGLYFTDIKNILDFLDYGEQIALIEVPDDSQIYTENDKFKADKFIIKNIIDDEREILKLFKINPLKPQSDICLFAAKNGYLETLKWARANGRSWNELTCAYAAKNGHLETLKWARENGCPWDGWTCAGAAQGGHLEILKWSRVNGCPWNKRTCEYAAANNHLEILEWARDNECQCRGEYH